MPSPFWKKLGRDLMRPAGNGLARIGVTANTVTFIGLLFAVACGLMLARGEWLIGFVFLALSSLCDLLDGAVARAHGRSGTQMGAALDSTADRYGEAMILAGVLVNGIERNVSEWFLWLWVLAFTASFLTSYVRARAEGLGLKCEVGILERPERLVLLGILCLLGPRSVPYILGLLALGGHITFIQRLLLIWRASKDAEGKP